MRRLLFLIAVSVGALVAAPPVLADTPLFSTSGDDTGVVNGNTRYVLYHSPVTGTTVSALATSGGAVLRQLILPGYWYFPNTAGGAEGISHDGKTLLLVDITDKTQSRRSTLAVIDPLRMKVVRSFKPYAATCAAKSCGSSSFVLTDALSPDASRLYAVEYTDILGVASPCGREYGIDLRTQQTVAVRKDVSPDGSEGSPFTRAMSADGRWDYTLYEAPSGASFIQALDTVGAAVHCVDLPKSRGTDAGLSLGNDDRTLLVSRSGGPSLDVAVGSWRISQALAAAAFPWVWLVGGIGGLGLLAAGGSVLWRRRGEKFKQRTS